MISFFGFGILAIDGYSTIYWISFVVCLLVTIILLMYSVVNMKLLLYLFFPVIYASFSVYEHSAIILDNLELETSDCLICHFNVMLFHLGALMWLSYVLFGIISRVVESIQLHLKLQLLAVAQAWQCMSMAFVTSCVLYLIIWVSFVNWWLTI